MAWTEKMVEDLKIMWKQGLTTGEIGKRLGVSKNSIVGKVHRLQLDARPSPIKKKDEEQENAAEECAQTDNVTEELDELKKKYNELKRKPNRGKKNLPPLLSLLPKNRQSFGKTLPATSN